MACCLLPLVGRSEALSLFPTVRGYKRFPVQECDRVFQPALSLVRPEEDHKGAREADQGTTDIPTIWEPAFDNP